MPLRRFLRGIRASIPSGYVLGRLSPGEGDVELLSPSEIVDVAEIGERLIPAGGADGDVLTKVSGSDYDVDWEAPAVTDPIIYGTFFGDGSDGDATVTTAITPLARDMYYNNLTISGSGSINANGYRIFVKGILDISAAGVDAIFVENTTRHNGANASTSTGGQNGQQAAIQGTVGSGASAGSTGGNGSTTTGAQAGAVTETDDGLGGDSGTAGAGGDDTAAAGTAGRAGLTLGRTIDMRYLTVQLSTWINTGASWQRPAGGAGGPGGSGGNGDGVGTGGGGGGGGSGAGVILVAAKTINRSGSTAAGAIRARGGNGGNGAGGSGGTNRGGGGGGSGGGGGWVVLIYKTLTGSTATNAVASPAGSGGTGGNGTGTGRGGVGGSAGGGGRIDVYDLGANTQTITNVTAVVAGGAASGNTGGTGGVAAAQAVSL